MFMSSASATAGLVGKNNPAFPVHFSNPSPLYRFAPDPHTHWKLLGVGEIVFKRTSIVLCGQRRRPSGSIVPHSAEIPVSEVLNVTRKGRVLRFDVRIPLCADKSLQLWAADESAAQDIVVLLEEVARKAADSSRSVEWRGEDPRAAERLDELHAGGRRGRDDIFGEPG
jgi:hypothetical protein